MRQGKVWPSAAGCSSSTSLEMAIAPGPTGWYVIFYLALHRALGSSYPRPPRTPSHFYDFATDPLALAQDLNEWRWLALLCSWDFDRSVFSFFLILSANEFHDTNWELPTADFPEILSSQTTNDGTLQFQSRVMKIGIPTTIYFTDFKSVPSTPTQPSICTCIWGSGVIEMCWEEMPRKTTANNIVGWCVAQTRCIKLFTPE